MPLILEDGEWLDWLPSEGHPLRRRFLDLRTDWLGPERTEQKQLLEQTHEADGFEHFVASLPAVPREDGGRTTYTVRGEGVETLLPEADKVVLIKK